MDPLERTLAGVKCAPPLIVPAFAYRSAAGDHVGQLSALVRRLRLLLWFRDQILLKLLLHQLKVVLNFLIAFETVGLVAILGSRLQARTAWRSRWKRSIWSYFKLII